MNKKLIITVMLIMTGLFAQAQRVGASPEYIIALTSKWKGERFADGRPEMVSVV